MSVEQYKTNLAAASTVAQVSNCLHGDLPYVAADYATKEALVYLTVARLNALDPEGGTRGLAMVTEEVLA